jgi:hypothetical protein
MATFDKTSLLLLNPEIIKNNYELDMEKSIIVTSFIQTIIELLIDCCTENLKLDDNFDFDEPKIISKKNMRKSFMEIFNVKKLSFDEMEQTTTKKLNTLRVISFIDPDIKLTQNSKTLIDNIVCYVISKIIIFLEENENEKNVGDLIKDENKIIEMLELKEIEVSKIILDNIDLNIKKFKMLNK